MEEKTLIQNIINNMKEIQQKIIGFLEKDNPSENDFIDLKSFLINQQISENKYKLRSLFHLIAKISNNYHHSSHFYSQIDQIIQLYKNEIQQNFSNQEIFNTFKGSKRILLFLFEENILEPNTTIASIITSPKYQKRYYPQYFIPEFKSIFDESQLKQIIDDYERSFRNREVIKYDSESFKQLRKIGENDDYISRLIRDDSIVEFVTYVNQTNYQLSQTIKKSIFETNTFLIKNNPSLIEYAAFFGSIQIFQYLFNNKIRLSSFLWPFAIHGNNPDLIHFLEENQIKLSSQDIKKCLVESIKCHHNEIANYIMSNYLQDIENKQCNINFFSQSLKNHNYILFDIEFDEKMNNFCKFITENDENMDYNLLFDLCQHDYLSFVEIFLNIKNLNINMKTI
ncbi:hypothetical protein M9Y10_007985 [Tritrichomonas musculus]|uniref:DUF3447 domain-containing protein n=1 Tax=Tritrichomonas musculus TaxID=1915356 RepID=A0ABR2J3J7_9EUKA